MPRTHMDLTGHRYGRLIVIKCHFERNDYLGPHWECLCDCGNPAIVLGNNLRRKKNPTGSCGCIQKEAVRAASTTHGLRDSPEYPIWAVMKDRCYNEKHPHYDRYGGRGIGVCDEWKESFEAFYKDMGPRPSDDHTIERRNNDEGYNSNNCYWATMVEQANNRSSNTFYEYNGVSRTLAAWCRELNLKYSTTLMQIRAGRTFSDIASKAK